MSDKLSKKSQHYSVGIPKAHCGICAHYVPPARCEIISEAGPPTPGRIDTRYWCRKFKAKK